MKSRNSIKGAQHLIKILPNAMTNSSGILIGAFKDERRIKHIDQIVKDFVTSPGYVLDHQSYHPHQLKLS